MLTLTFPGAGVHDYAEYHRFVASWIHHGRGGEWLRGRGAYLWVHELHPDGHGYHAHILFPGGKLTKAELEFLRRDWTRHLAGRGVMREDGGRWVRIHVKHFASPRRAAVYAAKYVGKVFAESSTVPVGAHRYEPMQGMELPPVSETRFGGFDAALASLPHPGFWDSCFDGRPDEGPFFWVGIDSPT